MPEVRGVPQVRVLHMADMHLEWPFTGLGARGRLRREELKTVFAGIIDLAVRESVQVLLIAGDLLEQQYATRGTARFLDQQFRRIPDTHVFISPGNHDPYLPGDLYETYGWAENIHIFGPEPERIDIAGLPVSVLGWGFPAWEVRQWQLGRVPAGDPGRINLAVIHGGEGVYHPFGAAELAALQCDYVALGHIHRRGVVLEEVGRVLAQYPGSPEGLGFGEPGEHGVLLGNVGKDSTRMAFVPTSARRYETIAVDVSDAAATDDLVAAIRRVAPADERRQHCYRLELTGSVDPDLTVDANLLEEWLREEFYLLQVSDRTQPDYDLAALSAERSVRGAFVRRLLEQEALESGEDGRRRIRRALALGLAAFSERGGRRAT